MHKTVNIIDYLIKIVKIHEIIRFYLFLVRICQNSCIGQKAKWSDMFGKVLVLHVSSKSRSFSFENALVFLTAKWSDM